MPVIGYYNGQFIQPDESVVPIDERGHQFGDGVYEVIRIYNGQPFLLEWHVERLLSSLEAVRITSPYDKEEYIDLIRQLIQKSNEPESTVYLQVTRGAAKRNHLFPDGSTKAAVSLVVRPYHAKAAGQPGKLLLLPDERWANAYIKTLNLLPNVLAKQTAHDAGADEALLVRDGRMIEASSSNLWFVQNGELVTAPTDRYILPGITRRFVMDLARELGIPVREEKPPLADLSSADGIFLTGTTTEVYPIGTVLACPSIKVDALPDIAGHPTNAQPSDTEVVWRASNLEIVLQLQEAFRNRVQEFYAKEIPVSS